jgi:hypothetical protein
MIMRLHCSYLKLEACGTKKLIYMKSLKWFWCRERVPRAVPHAARVRPGAGPAGGSGCQDQNLPYLEVPDCKQGTWDLQIMWRVFIEMRENKIWTD